MGWIRGLSTWVLVVLMCVQAAAQEPVDTANIAGRELLADHLTCACGDQRPSVWACGDVVLVFFDGRTSVRFGRAAGLARPRVLAALRSSTGRYFVVADEGLFELIIENTPERSLWCASSGGFLHLASVRDLAVTRVP